MIKQVLVPASAIKWMIPQYIGSRYPYHEIDDGKIPDPDSCRSSKIQHSQSKGYCNGKGKTRKVTRRFLIQPAPLMHAVETAMTFQKRHRTNPTQNYHSSFYILFGILGISAIKDQYFIRYLQFKIFVQVKSL